MISLKRLLSEQSNSQVKAIQRKLVDAGYDIGSAGVDGILGKRTLAALEKYRKEKVPSASKATAPEVLKSLTGQDINLSSQLTQQGTGTSDFQSFKEKLAKRLGIKLTPAKSDFFDAWRAVENTKATNNPFATTLNYKKDPGMTKFNLANRGQGVKNFSTLDYGVDAIATTLGLRYYSSLIEKLKNDNISAAELAKDSSLDTWGTGSAKIQRVLGAQGGSGDALPKDNTEKTSEKSELDRLQEINKILWNRWGRVQKVVTLKPEQYFSKYKGTINDNEDGAVDWFVDKFYNPMTQSFPKFKAELEKIDSNGARLVIQNIDNLNRIAQFVRELIQDDKTGEVYKDVSKFHYLADNGNWYSKQFKFKWDYM